jgi:hypothetical protein
MANTRSVAQDHMHTAQELSLLRHSLADELSFLSQELVSSLGGPEGKPTLLEDIETLHRSLKELESVKGYVQVVEHALKIGYVLPLGPGAPGFDACIVIQLYRKLGRPRHTIVYPNTRDCRLSPMKFCRQERR